jgi:hypothetical protein
MDAQEFFDQAESRFGTDDNMGVAYDESTGSCFPDGRLFNCTNAAIQVMRALSGDGMSVEIVGFANEDNPNCDAVREGWHPGGHDFALVDQRFLVDPWARSYINNKLRIAYDLENPKDAEFVLRTYGPMNNWDLVLKSGTKEADKALGDFPLSLEPECAMMIG